MKKVKIILLALAALGMVGCGGGASKDDACSCTDETETGGFSERSVCEETWDSCDALDGGDAKECKDGLKDLMCP